MIVIVVPMLWGGRCVIVIAIGPVLVLGFLFVVMPVVVIAIGPVDVVVIVRRGCSAEFPRFDPQCRTANEAQGK